MGTTIADWLSRDEREVNAAAARAFSAGVAAMETWREKDAALQGCGADDCGADETEDEELAERIAADNAAFDAANERPETPWRDPNEGEVLRW